MALAGLTRPELAVTTRGAAVGPAITVGLDRDTFGCDVIYAQRQGTGALDGADLAAAARGVEHALSAAIPFVMVMDRIGFEVIDGLRSLTRWGRLAKALTSASGRIPTVAILDGEMVGSASLILGLFDLVVCTNTASATVGHPGVIYQVTGVAANASMLGGAGPLTDTSAVACAAAADMDEAIDHVADLLSFLPANNNELPPMRSSADPATRLVPELTNVVPSNASSPYDTRDVIEVLADEDDGFLELWGAWARNVVVGFCRIDGRAVGVVANQTQHLAGTLDIEASHKAARFIQICDSYNVSLLTLVDTSGFLPGKQMEWEGMIRHGAQMAFAYISATVPRINLTLRKSYGGAYIVMDSKRIGNDLSFAWPSAEIAVMGADGATSILHRTATAEEQAELKADYEATWMNPYVAADRGLVDDVIDPAESRAKIAAGFRMLDSKAETIPDRKHDNMPL